MKERGSWHGTVVFWLGVVVTAGFFWVNIAGFVDTFTGSALGCGHHWPSCNGDVIPSLWGLETLIEFLHRAMVGIVVLLLVAFSVLSLLQYRAWREVRWFIGMSFFFTIVQSFLGALGVLLPHNPPALLAIHLGVSLMALNSVFLATVIVGQIRRRERKNDIHAPLRLPLPNATLKRWAWFTTVYTFIAMYVGAYVASTGDGGMFIGWPLPAETYQQVGSVVFIDIVHRVLALGAAALLIRIAVLSYRTRSTHPGLYTASLISVALVIMQAISGMLLIVTHLSITAFLLHVSILSCLFAVLCYICLEVMPECNRKVPTV